MKIVKERFDITLQLPNIVSFLLHGRSKAKIEVLHLVPTKIYGNRSWKALRSIVRHTHGRIMGGRQKHDARTCSYTNLICSDREPYVPVNH
jgi:hypothetical protein